MINSTGEDTNAVSSPAAGRTVHQGTTAALATEAAETEDRRGIADGVQSGDIATVGIGTVGTGGDGGSGGVQVGYVSAAATPWPIDMLQAASSSQTDDARLDPEESHAPSC